MWRSFLDPWLPPQATERDEGLAELAISFAATALHDISTRGHSRLTIAIAGREPRCQSGPASAAFCEALLAELAEVPLGEVSSVAEGLQRAIEAAPRGARLIVISPRAADDQSLIANETELEIDPDDFVDRRGR